MSNWQYPQWIMASLFVLALVARIVRYVDNSRKSDAELLLSAKTDANNWEVEIFKTTIIFMFEVWLLAKGGFWG